MTPDTPEPTTTPPPPAGREDLERRLADLGIEVETHDHPPVFTVAESEDLHRRIPGAHTKNLFLKDAKGRLFLVVAHHATEVALKGLHRKLGAARFSFGKPDVLMQALGVTPGSVTAFALMNDAAGQVTAVIDSALISHDVINAHPLRNDATTSIARADLFRFMEATGHEPVVVDLTEAPSDPPA